MSRETVRLIVDTLGQWIDKCKARVLELWSIVKPVVTVLWKMWMVMATQFIFHILFTSQVYSVHGISSLFHWDGPIGTIGGRGMPLYPWEWQFRFLLPVISIIILKVAKIPIGYWIASIFAWYIWGRLTIAYSYSPMESNRVINYVALFSTLYIWLTVVFVSLAKLPVFLFKKLKKYYSRWVDYEENIQ